MSVIPTIFDIHSYTYLCMYIHIYIYIPMNRFRGFEQRLDGLTPHSYHAPRLHIMPLLFISCHSSSYHALVFIPYSPSIIRYNSSTQPRYYYLNIPSIVLPDYTLHRRLWRRCAVDLERKDYSFRVCSSWYHLLRTASGKTTVRHV